MPFLQHILLKVSYFRFNPGLSLVIFAFLKPHSFIIGMDLKPKYSILNHWSYYIDWSDLFFLSFSPKELLNLWYYPTQASKLTKYIFTSIIIIFQGPFTLQHSVPLLGTLPIWFLFITFLISSHFCKPKSSLYWMYTISRGKYFKSAKIKS